MSEAAGVDRRVTVVVPTKDRPRYLLRCVDLVLGQVDVDLDVVVVDDGSVTPLIEHPSLRRLLCDRRVRVVRHDESRGVAAARNTGARAASAPWVAFVDDDDLWAPDKLSSQLDALGGERPHGWCYVGAVHLGEDLDVLRVSRIPDPGALGELLSRFNAVPGGGSSVLVATELLRELGGFDETFSVLADWDMWLRLAERSSPVVVSRPLVGYVRHPASMSVDSIRSMREFSRLETKHTEPDRRHGPVRFDRAMYHLYLAELEFAVGRRTRGVALSARAVAEQPLGAMRLAVRRFVIDRLDRLGKHVLAKPADADVEALVERWRSADRRSRSCPSSRMPPPENTRVPSR